MDTDKIIQTLGLIDGGTLSITDVQFTQWGRQLIFACDYQTVQPDGTPDSPVLFRLVFGDCRDIRWKTYAHIALMEVGTVPQRTELAELSLGQGNHRRDANMLTAHFGVMVSYGDLVIEYENHSYTL